MLVCTVKGPEVKVSGIDVLPEPHPDVLRVLDLARLDYQDLIGEPPDLHLLLIEAIAMQPALFRQPQAPLGELLAAAGLRVTSRGWVVGDNDEDDRDDDSWDDDGPDDDTKALVAHLVRDHHLSQEQAAGVVVLGQTVETFAHEVVEQLYDQVLDQDEADPATGTVEAMIEVSATLDPDDPDSPIGVLMDLASAGGPVAQVMTMVLTHSDVTRAYLHDIVGPDQMMAMLSLTAFRALPTPRDRHARANLHFLQGRLLEFVTDDHANAEREFRQALQIDRDHGEAMYALALYKSDRGDAGAALGLLRQLSDGGGMPDLTEVLERFAAPGPMTAGRNEVCPCGSGRKHKVCCATTNGWTLAHRQPWLLLKQALFAASAPSAALLDDLADIAGDHPLDNVVVRALAFHEGGLIDEFLRLRGSLLPPDEFDLLRQYTGVRASALLVVEVTPGQGLVVLDHTSGERIILHDRSLSTSLEVDDLALGWILPTPYGPEPAGAVLPVPEHARASLLSLIDGRPDAEEIAAWLAALMAPPTMQNREGHALLFTELVYELADVAAARAVLMTADGLATEDDEFVQLIEMDGESLLAARLVLDGEDLVIEVNSRERSERLQTLVARLLPDAVLVDVDITTPPPGAPTMGSMDLGDLSEDEATDLMDELMIEAEDRWVGQSIPALGGATPRDAAADPTRRGDLERLLRDFEASEADWTGPGRPMSAARLRDLLGLDR